MHASGNDAVLLLDNLVDSISGHDGHCNIYVDHGIIHEEQFRLLLSKLKTRNLYKIDINQVYNKLQSILHSTPMYLKHSLINTYFAHSWISHVSYKYHVTLLNIFVTLMKKYVIRKHFKTMWNIIILLLQNGAYPLLNPQFMIDDPIKQKQRNILSLHLICSLYQTLFNFIDDEQEILQRITYVLSFVEQFPFHSFAVHVHQLQNINNNNNDSGDNTPKPNLRSLFQPIRYQIANNYPSIMSLQIIPTPLFLCTLFDFGFPLLINAFGVRIHEMRKYQFPFSKYHSFFVNKQLLNTFQPIYESLEKHANYPVLCDGLYDLILSFRFGVNDCKQLWTHETRNMELFNLFALNTEWIKWSFENVWINESDESLHAICANLSDKHQLKLRSYSPRIRESSSLYPNLIEFYLKSVSYQNSLSCKEISFWMKKYENDSEILQLLFKQKYDINTGNNGAPCVFNESKLYEYFWNLLTKKNNKNHVCLRLLIKHLVEQSAENKDFEIVWKSLYNDFCDKLDDLNWKFKANAMGNFIELLQKWKLNDLDICNTEFGFQSLFSGGCVKVFLEFVEHNLLTVNQIEKNTNDGFMGILLGCFRKRGKYIQERHINLVIAVGKWLLEHDDDDSGGGDKKYGRLLNEFCGKCYNENELNVSSDALRRKCELIVDKFKREFSLLG